MHLFFLDKILNLDGSYSGDEVEHPCTNNSEGCEDQENQGSETRKLQKRNQNTQMLMIICIKIFNY